MKLNKKTIAFAAALMLCAQSAVVALAQPVYDSTAGTVSIGAGDISGLNGTEFTVLVVKEGTVLNTLQSDDIFYIDQASNPAQAFVNMGVKGGTLEPGNYTMLLGADQSTEPNTLSFTVSTAKPELPEAIPGTVPASWSDEFTLNENNYYNYGCTGIINNYDSSQIKEFGVKLAYQKDDIWYSTSVPFSKSIPQIDGGGSVQFGFIVENVPADWKDTFESRPYVTLNENEGV